VAGKLREAGCSLTNSGTHGLSTHELLEAFQHPQAAGVPRHRIQNGFAIGRQAEAVEKEARPWHEIPGKFADVFHFHCREIERKQTPRPCSC